MPPDGVIALFIVAFIGVPTTVETVTCYNPTPDSQGAVCNWKEKQWVKEFDIDTLEHYYTLKEFDKNDNFIESAMRKRYLKRGGRYVTNESKRTDNRRKMDRRSI